MRLKPLPALLASCLATWSLTACASASGLVISQVYGAGGNSGATFNRDYVELFNAGTQPVSLNGWSLQYAAATGTGNFSANSPFALPGVTLQPGQYFLVALASGSNGAALPAAGDASGTAPNLSGSAGKVALVSSTTGLACNGGSTACTPAQAAQIIDLVGFGSANFFEGSVGPATTATTALYRAANGCTDTHNNAADFTTAAPVPRNTASPLAPCNTSTNAPISVSCPALNVTAGQAGSVTLSANDADSRVNGASITAGGVTGLALGSFVAAAAEGDTATVVLNTAASLSAGNYPVQVTFTNDEAQNASCTVQVAVGAAPSLTRIFQIQGSGSASPLAGQGVTTEGVVTAVMPGLSGYYLQDETGDGDELTSDGIFVYSPGGISVQAGDRVRLSATVTEFNTITELTSPANLVITGSGPTPAPTPINLPEAVNGDLERYEGMLVTIAHPMTVAQNYFQGRYGQLTLAADGRVYQPTNLHRPGTPAALALADENARRLLILDDGSSAQNPNPIPFIGADQTNRAGDSVTNLVGVIDHGLITADSNGARDYKLHVTQTPVFSRDNPRTTAPAPVGGNVRVASFNVLNYFTTIDQSGASCAPSGTRSDCRGADSAEEFTRQRTKIVHALAALNADVVGVIEIQNNGATAIGNLVAALNAQVGAGTYAAVADPATGTGTDAIKVGLIYKPGRLTLQGASTSDNRAVHNRPPVAQTFAAANGEAFSVVINHFKSKSCDGASGTDQDQGDGQGCYNARRLQQAQALRGFVANLQATSGDTDVIVLGDFNAYAQEDPIFDLTSSGYTDLIARFDPLAYSYVFDGASGYLDSALATPSLNAQVTGAAEWHINADEPSVIDYNTEFKPQDLYSATPYRSSDHDPLVVGLNLVKKITGTTGRDTLLGSAGDDLVTGGEGADTLTGNGGRDVFAYRTLRDAGDTVTDFVPGTDRLDLGALLASLGVTPGQALAQGVVRVTDSAAGTVVQIDSDGSTGTGPARPLVTLRGVSTSQIDPARDLGL